MEHDFPTGESSTSSDAPTSTGASTSQTTGGNSTNFTSPGASKNSNSSTTKPSQTSSSKKTRNSHSSSSNSTNSLNAPPGFQAPLFHPYFRHHSHIMRGALPLIPTPTRSIWNISICPTTGGQFQLCATPDETIDGLKKTIAKKLKLSKERITLLLKDRVLKEGSLRDNGILEGSRLTLLPNVESGLMSQKPEHTVMQALEGLSEIQVNDFLSGKSPLTLAMRLGDHMMFVQLQLSTSPPTSRRSSSSRTSHAASHTSSSRHQPSTPSTIGNSLSSSMTSSAASSSSLTSSAASSMTSSAASSPTLMASLPTPPLSPSSPSIPSLHHGSATPTSPLGLSPFMLPHIPLPSPHLLGYLPPTSPCTSPTCSSPSMSPISSSTDSAGSSPASTPPSSPRTIVNPPSLMEPTPERPRVAKPTPVHLENVPLLDSSTLAEASRNLSLKLKELSSQGSPPVSPTKEVPQASTSSSPAANDKNGAIIESMQHHGQGIYSGTFSGTLNPALQDRDGKPKRSISTIVHILNDLLGATPQYRAQVHARTSTHGHNHHQHQHRITPSSSSSQHHHHRSHKHHQHAKHHGRPGSPSERRGGNVKAAGERLRLSQENRATRGKMEQLQSMLEERRQRRRARREARVTPYAKTWGTGGQKLTPPASPHPSNSQDKNREDSSMEVDDNLDTATNMADGSVQEKGNYGELSQETVVA